MSLPFSLLLISLQLSGIRAVSISTGNGDVSIRVEKGISSVEAPYKFVQFKTDTLVILNSWNSSISLAFPESLSLGIKSVNGEISVTGSYLKSIDISSFSGDVRVNISKADFVKISSRTGDIYLRYGDTTGTVDIHSRTGDIVYKGQVFENLSIHSVTGDIDIYTSGSEGKIDLSKISSIYGDVEIYDETTGNFKILKTNKKRGKEETSESKKGLRKINILKKVDHTKNFARSFIPFSTWKRPHIEFTKVDGFTLNVPFGDSEEGDFYGGYLGYAFSAKRFDLYFHGFKRVYKPIFLYFRLYSERRSPDAWKLSSGENTLSSILFHEDFADFYHATGIGAFAGISAKSSWIEVGIERQELENLSNKTDWSLFFKDSKTYYPNRPIKEGKLEFVKLEGFFNLNNNLTIKTEIEHQISSYYPKFSRAFLSSNISVEPFSGINILSQVRAGYSPDTLVSPFDFYIGGPFTIPGFSWKAFYGDRWMALINTFLLFDIADNTFFLRLDAGKTNRMDNPELDIGIGTILDGIYFGVAFPISEFQGNPNLFAGLRRNF